MNGSYNNSLLTDDNKRLWGWQIHHRYYTAKTNLGTVYLSTNKPAEMEQMLRAEMETDIALSAHILLGGKRDQVVTKHILLLSEIMRQEMERKESHCESVLQENN